MAYAFCEKETNLFCSLHRLDIDTICQNIIEEENGITETTCKVLKEGNNEEDNINNNNNNSNNNNKSNNKSNNNNSNNSTNIYACVIPSFLEDDDISKEDFDLEKNSLESYVDDDVSTIVTNYEEEMDIEKKKESSLENIHIITVQGGREINDFERILSKINNKDHNVEKKLNDLFYDLCCRSIATINTQNLRKTRNKNKEGKRGSLKIEHIDYGDIFLTIFNSIDKTKDTYNFNTLTQDAMKFFSYPKERYERKKNRYSKNSAHPYLCNRNSFKDFKNQESWYNYKNEEYESTSLYGNDVKRRKVVHYYRNPNQSDKVYPSKFNSRCIGYDEFCLKDRTFLKKVRFSERINEMYYYPNNMQPLGNRECRNHLDAPKKNKMILKKNLKEKFIPVLNINENLCDDSQQKEKDEIQEKEVLVEHISTNDNIYHSSFTTKREEKCLREENRSKEENQSKKEENQSKEEENRSKEENQSKEEENQSKEKRSDCPEKNEECMLLQKSKFNNDAKGLLENDAIEGGQGNAESNTNAKTGEDLSGAKTDTIFYGQFWCYNYNSEDDMEENKSELPTDTKLNEHENQNQNDSDEMIKNKDVESKRETLFLPIHCEEKTKTNENQKRNSKDIEDNGHKSISVIGTCGSNIIDASSEANHIALVEDENYFDALIKDYEHTKITKHIGEDITSILNEIEKEDLLKVPDYSSEIAANGKRDEKKKENAQEAAQKNDKDKEKNNEKDEEKIEVLSFLKENHIEVTNAFENTNALGYRHNLNDFKEDDPNIMDGHELLYSGISLPRDNVIESKGNSSTDRENKNLEVREKDKENETEAVRKENEDSTEEGKIDSEEIETKCFLQKLKEEVTKKLTLNFFDGSSDVERENTDFIEDNENGKILEGAFIEKSAEKGGSCVNNEFFKDTNFNDDVFNDEYFDGGNFGVDLDGGGNFNTAKDNDNFVSVDFDDEYFMNEHFANNEDRVGQSLRMTDLNGISEATKDIGVHGYDMNVSPKEGMYNMRYSEYGSKNFFFNDSSRFSENKKHMECQTDFPLNMSRNLSRSPRKKNVEVKLIQKKIDSEQKTRETNNENRRRYPKRNRHAPLRHWIGEKEITRRNPVTGEIEVVGISKCKNEEELSPHLVGPISYTKAFIKKVIRISEMDEEENDEQKEEREGNVEFGKVSSPTPTNNSNSIQNGNINSPDEEKNTTNQKSNSMSVDKRKFNKGRPAGSTKRKRKRFINIMNYIQKRRGKRLRKSVGKSSNESAGNQDSEDSGNNANKIYLNNNMSEGHGNIFSEKNDLFTEENNNEEDKQFEEHVSLNDNASVANNMENEIISYETYGMHFDDWNGVENVEPFQINMNEELQKAEIIIDKNEDQTSIRDEIIIEDHAVVETDVDEKEVNKKELIGNSTVENLTISQVVSTQKEDAKNLGASAITKEFPESKISLNTIVDRENISEVDINENTNEEICMNDKEVNKEMCVNAAKVNKTDNNEDFLLGGKSLKISENQKDEKQRSDSEDKIDYHDKKNDVNLLKENTDMKTIIGVKKRVKKRRISVLYSDLISGKWNDNHLDKKKRNKEGSVIHFDNKEKKRNAEKVKNAIVIEKNDIFKSEEKQRSEEKKFKMNNGESLLSDNNQIIERNVVENSKNAEKCNIYDSYNGDDSSDHELRNHCISENGHDKQNVISFGIDNCTKQKKTVDTIGYNICCNFITKERKGSEDTMTITSNTSKIEEGNGTINEKTGVGIIKNDINETNNYKMEKKEIDNVSLSSKVFNNFNSGVNEQKEGSAKNMEDLEMSQKTDTIWNNLINTDGLTTGETSVCSQVLSLEKIMKNNNGNIIDKDENENRNNDSDRDRNISKGSFVESTDFEKAEADICLLPKYAQGEESLKGIEFKDIEKKISVSSKSQDKLPINNISSTFQNFLQKMLNLVRKVN